MVASNFQASFVVVPRAKVASPLPNEPRRPGIRSARHRALRLDDFLLKCRHIQKILRSKGVRPRSIHVASEWAVAFSEESDPTFAVLDWLNAGWRDPLLVTAVLKLCGSRARAEECFRGLGTNVSSRYRPELIPALVNAMVTPSHERHRPRRKP